MLIRTRICLLLTLRNYLCERKTISERTRNALHALRFPPVTTQFSVSRAFFFVLLHVARSPVLFSAPKSTRFYRRHVSHLRPTFNEFLAFVPSTRTSKWEHYFCARPPSASRKNKCNGTFAHLSHILTFECAEHIREIQGEKRIQCMNEPMSECAVRSRNFSNEPKH